MSKKLVILGGHKLFEQDIPFTRPYLPEFNNYTCDFENVYSSGMLTKGKYLNCYEKRVSDYQGGLDTVGVSSATLGITMTLQSLGIGAGDEVIVPSFTFCATVHPIINVGAIPVFIDCRSDSLCIDDNKIISSITSRTKAIVAVHIFGVPANVDRLREIADRFGLYLIYDAAHAFGTQHNNKPIGTFGDVSVFSTSPTKTLVTGEGGLVITSHKEVADKIRLIREYGNPGNYNCTVCGTNGRLSEVASITGLMSLSCLDKQLQIRKAVGDRYRHNLSSIKGIYLQCISEDDFTTFKDMPILINQEEFGLNRDLLDLALKYEGIPTRKYFYPAVHAMDAYRAYNLLDLPITKRISNSILCLPIHAYLSNDDVDGICDVIREAQCNSKKIRNR